MTTTYQPSLDEIVEYFCDRATESMKSFFNGANMPWQFFDALKQGLKMKSEWAEDLAYQADLTDKEIAALKGDTVLLRDLLADVDY